MPAFSLPTGRLSGSSTFRMMPTDAFYEAPSDADVTPAAGGAGVRIAYAWAHPADGVQHGEIIVGGQSAEGAQTFAWLDSWHQPFVRLLEGAATDASFTGALEYDGWGWTITVTHDAPTLRLQMCNVVPEGIDGAEPGPYVVMDAAWVPAD